jgi:hypothetical protein
MKGVAPFQAAIYDLERWRGGDGCEDVFTALGPTGVGGVNYEASLVALIGEMRYSTGLHLNWIQRLQQIFGIPNRTALRYCGSATCMTGRHQTEIQELLAGPVTA